MQKALPLMKDGGSIIVTGSGVWQKGIPIYATYGATKAALRSFVRTWTAEFASKGIRANMISPGPTETACTIQRVNVALKTGDAKRMVVRETNCFERRSGEWKLIHQHASVPAGGDWDGKITTT